MKNLLNNLLNWVLKKGPSETEKDQVSLRAIRYAAVLFMVLMVGVGQAWGTTYYVIPAKCNVSAGALVAGADGSTQLFKTDESTVTVNTDISTSVTATAGVYYNSTSTTYANLTNTSNYSTSSGSSRTMRGIKLEASVNCTITVNTKRFSKLDVIYRCASNDSKTLTIDGVGCNTSDKNFHLKSITKAYSSNIIISNGSDKEYDIFVILTETAAAKMVYLKNSMGWASAHVTLLGTSSYWDATNGSGSSRKTTYTMSYDSGKQLFYVEVPSASNDTYLAFTKDKQENYGNFYNTEAVYVNGGYSFGKVVWVGTSTTFYKNGTKYYGNEDHTQVNKEDYSADVFLSGSYNSWAKNAAAKFTEGTPYTKTVSLTAGNVYTFKVVDNAWFGNPSWLTDDKGSMTFSQTDGDLTLLVGITGDYTFTYNRSTHVVAVDYPAIEHPSAGYIYLRKTWDHCHVHWWYNDGSDHALTTWGSDPEITTYTTICEQPYYYFPLLTTYNMLIGKDAAGDAGDGGNNKTGNMNSSSNGGKYIAYNSGWGWNSFGTYTISYGANGGGSSMSSETGICPNGSQTLTSNAFTPPSGCASFSHWTASVNVTANGTPVTAGNPIADGATLSNINSNITLTAVWKLSAPTIAQTALYNNFTISGSIGGATYYYTTDNSTPTTSSSAYSSAVDFDADITAKAIAHKTGYVDSDVASLACTYINCSISSCGNATLTYTINGSTSVNNTAANLVSATNASNTTALGVPAASSAVTLSTMVFDGNAGKAVAKANGCYTTSLIMSSKLSVYNGSAFNTSHYLQFSFTVKEGYTFTPCDIQFVVQPTSYATDFRWEVTDGTSTYGYGTASGVGTGSDAGATVLTGLTSPSMMSAGTYYIRLYPKFKKDGKTNDFRIADEVILKGTTAAAACTAPTTVDVSATVNEVAGYWFYPGDAIVLTATPTGSPAGSPVTYQWKNGGVDIVGATSSTYSVASATKADAGNYTCTISYGACSTTSASFQMKCMQFYLKNSGGGDISNHVLVKEDATHASLTLELTGGTTYKFRVTDGCNDWYGNTGEMTSSSCTDWRMEHDADCRITTNSTTGDYTFLFDFTDGILGNQMKVSVVYPGGDQASGKTIYWDNSVLNWAAGNQWYRIGTKTGNTKTQMTLVPGTANLYKVTTAEYLGFQNWHIANNEGEGTSNVFWTKDSDPATNEAITAAMAYDGTAVTSVVTVTPTTTHATGATSDNNNCEFYTYSKMYVMKTDAVSITAPSNGTITVAYTDVAGVAQSFTSGSENLAHTVIITPTATPATGYDLGGLTVNAVAHTSGNTYTCSGATVVAATFTPHVYTITLNKGDHGASNQSASVAYLDDELTSITPVSSTGYTLTGYYDGSTKVLNADGSFAGTDITGYIEDGVWTKTADATLTAKWTAKSYTLTLDKNHSSASAPASTSSVNYDATSFTPTAPTYTDHTVDGYYTSDNCTTMVATAAGALQASITVSETAWTNSSSEWKKDGNATFYAHWKCNTPEISCSSNTITISVPSGATVYYTTTTDGSTPADPTSSSTAYNPSSKPTISADTKIKAIAIQSGCTNSAIASANLTYVAPGPSYTAPTSALDISAQTSVTAAGLITAHNATQTHYLSTNTDTLLLIPNDIYYNIGDGKENTWATVNGSPGSTSADWSCPAGSVSFKGRKWWQSSGNISTLQVRSDRSLNIRVKGCKTVSVLNAANSSTQYFVMEAYEYDDGYKSSDPDVSASNTSTSVTETSLSLNSSKEYVVVLRGNTQHNNKVYEIKFIAPSSGYTVSIAANPAGYGTVSAASVTSVVSGTTLSASTNTLSVGATDVTASATSATAEYTYAFSNWTKSDGTALPSTVTADLSVYANFTRTENNYTLTWNTNGGSDLECDDCTSGSTAYNTTLVAPTDPTKSNYTFDGWNTANDGSGSAAAATMPAANTTYYAAWKQTVTLTTGAQGSGDNQTPYVYLNGTGVSSFTAHTASGYTLQGYYTAGSGGTKVLNKDGTFAAANVTDYITSGKWSRTGAAPTLYAQWVAAEDCHTLKYAWKVTGNFCDDKSTSVTASDTVRFPANASNLYFTESGTGNTVAKGSSYNIGKTQNNYFLLTAKSGYQFKSICFYGKIEDSSVNYTTDGSSWLSLSSTSTSSDNYYSFNNINASAFGIKLTETSPKGIWIRNMVIEVCASGDVTYNVTYDDNGSTGGTAPTDNTNYSYGGTVTVKDNGTLEKDNYTFAGWATNNDGTGSSYVEDNTFSITANTTLYAKWTQAVTFDANTDNHGSADGSATAVWNATGLTGITHATPASGYKLLGYYTAATSGTKVINSDGTFASTAVTDYITSGKWSRTGTAPTLYAQYESAGALTWNLIVNSDTANLSTSTKTSAFTEISTTNMTDASLTGLTYSKGKKSSLTGKISTPDSYNADKYVYVTFQVASGYKFTPSSISVKVQPVGENEHKAVKLSLADATNTLVSGSPTKCDGTSSGKTTTVTLAGNGTYFTGTVTLKIYVYADETASATANNCYRLGTPITIEGEIEEACATMPSYSSMSYTTTTFAPNADASGSPITIVGEDNIDTYQWKYNTVNDRTSGTNCGTNNASLTPLTDAGAAIDVTRYYWCEMTNDACGITIKSPAVAITVAAAKSDATVAWTDPASTPNYGGGGYTVKATVNETGWNGNAEDLTLSAPAGIRIYNIESGTADSKKYVQASFDVTTAFDRETYSTTIPFTVSAAATATYNAISNDHNVSYSACAGAGEGSSYNIRMRKTVTKDGNYYHCANTDGWISPNISSSYSTAKAGTKMETDFDTIASSNTQYVWVRTYHANVNKVRIYADFRANDMTVSNVYKHTDYFTANNKYLVDYTAVYNDDEENENTGTAAQGYVDIELDNVMAANDVLLVAFSTNKVRPLGAVITEGSAGSLNTHLQWSGSLADGETVNKYTTDAYFTYSASMITENTNSLGAITYSSSNTSVATVDATGKVALVAAGSTIIKATLAASGCYKKAEISYTLNVTEVPCAITAGTLTLTSGTESKCSSANVTLTLTGFESGASIQWKDGDTDIDNGGNYTIAMDGTTSTLTTDQEGTYSVMVTSGCSVRSNRITISNKSTEVGAKRIVKNWYIKNGRLTPDIELWTLQNGAHLSSVAWSPANTTGLTASDFYESDGKVYLKGKEPSSNTSGADKDYTLTLTVVDDCGSTTEMSASGQLIYLHHQKNTDKHVLAFVVTGTEKGGFTEGLTAAQTTSVELYNTIAANFDVLATNVYSTDDEQALKEYYSQFDILCVTDYPNTGTKGVNKKSYVDALGALVDIRPILTMEAFVSKLANWKAKGISGTPQSPTTRQYSMLLQCKDHEIFSGTKLTKVGEGDETMYRISMVCDTLEDYKTLDATYGAGTHEKDKNYQYGSKPALQGFTFTKEMLDDDLLPLGLIDDGSGNDLQVGIERQTEMEARLMVLGINSYAMERLTDDGQTVVVNALKYLMKKNSEDIADCSNTFVGGAEGDETNWNNAANWSGNTVPDKTQKVRIVAPCVIPAEGKAHVAGVIIAPNGTYNHGSDNATGSLTISAGAALIVDGKVEAATAPYFTKTRATSSSNLAIGASSTAQGALIFDNEEGETNATVAMYSASYWETVAGKKKKYWSYVALPIQSGTVGEYFYNGFSYLYDETQGWVKKGMYTELHAFEGLGISMQSGNMEYFHGPLAPTTTQEFTLTKTPAAGDGENLIGNSWTAPIQIANFDASDFGEATATVYVYNTGRDEQASGSQGSSSYGGTGSETAGQWVSVPISTAKEGGYTGLKVIPAMNAFQVNTSSETTLTLDYDKLVRGGATSAAVGDLTAPLRAPKRSPAKAQNGIEAMMRVRVSGTKTHTDVWLQQDSRFSEEFDNGWEAKYAECDNRSAQFYAQSEIGNMAFLALPDLEGTFLGFAPSRDGNEYLFTFHYVGEEEFYLNDLKLHDAVLINEENSYEFTYSEGDTNRFYISRTAINAPTVTTGVGNTRDGVKAQKILYNNKLYIIVNGRVYSAEGALVK